MLDTIKYENYEIKPWTLEKLEELSPVFEKFFLSLRGNNIKVDSIFTEPLLYLKLLPYLSKIISITIGEKEEVIKQFTLDKSMTITAIIFKQNIGYLKNLLSPIVEMLKEMNRVLVNG